MGTLVFLHISRPTSHAGSYIYDKCVFHCLDFSDNKSRHVAIE
jgi:hypothetical protein